MVSLRKRIFLSFLLVIILLGAISLIIGGKLIRESLLPKEKLQLDLRAAYKVYDDAVLDLRDIVRLTAFGFSQKGSLAHKDSSVLIRHMENIRKTERLDFLNITDINGAVLLRAANPGASEFNPATAGIIQQAAKSGAAVASTEILSAGQLNIENPARVKTAVWAVESTPGKTDDSTCLVIISAAPMYDTLGKSPGILCGGRIINGDFEIVRKIVDVVYEGEKFNGKDVCVSSIFLKNMRISTNLKRNLHESAVGTLVPDDVYQHISSGGTVYNKRVFAVLDWYITAYGPIKNSSGSMVGILGVGTLEAKVKNVQEKALILFLIISISAILLSVLISHFLAKLVMRPINSLIAATQNVAKGNLEQPVKLTGTPLEIAALGSAFNHMISSIKERDKLLKDRAQEEVMKSERLAMIGQLAAGVAHEINNPLGSILLFVRLVLQKAPDEGNVRDNLERIEKETKRCQNIVQGLLDFARQREPKAEPLNINDILAKTIAIFENQVLFQNVEFVKQYQADIPLVNVDPSQLQQVFVNILMNAADAMKSKGRLTIKTEFFASDETVNIHFGDTGCGIRPEIIDRIFEPFFTTKGVGHGTGLGLSISLGIVQRHGGDITVNSAVDRGTTFTIKLPEFKRNV